ncbi:PT domain-containing protein [Nostoc sp.]|uniref:PT domain-containing protein n=1 Tax=Nostoc sp. TaxID=1180 RepID=UPI002FF7433A
MKTKYRFLLASLTILVALFFLIFSSQKSSSQKPGKPTSAIVDFIKGYISTRLSETGQSTKIDPKQELGTQSIIEVPHSSGNVENWVHLQFKKGSLRLNPLVQIGPDSDDSDYIFPCNYSHGGGLWGVSKLNNNACNRIVIKKKGHRVPQKKSKQAKGSNNIFIAQADAEQFTVVPKGSSTLIYIHQDAGNTVVDVLTGSVTIDRITVRAGIRYIDAGNGSRRNTTPIPKEVYDLRPVQIFLDSNNWSENIRFDIQDFQIAVESQKSRPLDPVPDIPDIPPLPQPTIEPTTEPIRQPTIEPSVQPTAQPTTYPR